MSNCFFVAFFCMYLAYLAVEIGLDWLNLKHLKKMGDSIPELFSETVTQAENRMAQAYTRAKSHFHVAQLLYSAALLWTMILSGFFSTLNNWIPQPIAYVLAIAGILYFFQLPFSIYFQFILESRFGFNRTTYKTYFMDQLKILSLSAVIGSALLWALFGFVSYFASTWWIWGAALIVGFQLLMAAVFPVLLMPLFYKLTPLPDGDLKTEITTLANRLNFAMSGIYTMDASKRSAHSNAFFAGIGKMRRIVLFDTLLNQLSQRETIAVLAHEMGHNIKKHIQKNVLLSTAVTFFAMWALSRCMEWPLFYQAFGVQTLQAHIAFVLFGLFASVFAFPLTPLFHALSRRFEYEADAFSVSSVGDKQAMVSSLVKLSKENASNLTPHPAYSFYHYSHPTTLERANAINGHLS